MQLIKGDVGSVPSASRDNKNRENLAVEYNKPEFMKCLLCICDLFCFVLFGCRATLRTCIQFKVCHYRRRRDGGVMHFWPEVSNQRVFFSFFVLE